MTLTAVPISEFEPTPRVIPAYWLKHAHQAMTETAKAYPGLNRAGWHTGLNSQFSQRSVATAIAYIICGPVKCLSKPTESSYALKHSAERWGRRIGFEPYVGNGDMILAAIYCQFQFGKRHGPNCAIALRDVWDSPNLPRDRVCEGVQSQREMHS